MSERLCRGLLWLLLLSPLAVQAQQEEVHIEDFAWLDRNHMAQQVDRIDKLARTRLGTRLREDRSDLRTLQRIIDRELIAEDDQLRLQALGAVLGNVMVAEVDELEWKVYEDDKGRTRAVCIQDTEQCLFPITMLSRRIEAGLQPEVERVYREALDLAEPYLPEMPYGGS